MSDLPCIIITLNGKRKKMEITIGQLYTTANSGVQGIVKEIVGNNNGTKRVLLDVNGTDRWTTAK